MGRVDSFTPPPFDDDRDWCTPEAAAARMGTTVQEIDALIRMGALRARRVGWAVEVEPAILPRREGQPEGRSEAKPRRTRTARRT
jgi:hypothetical protein